MGKIVVSSAISVDGYTEGARGDIMAMPLDQAFNTHNAELIRRAGSLLYGATTYLGMVAYWPGQLDNPDASQSSTARRLADGLPITVVSDRLTAADTGPWHEQTTIVARSEAHRAVAALRERNGDTVVFGSRTLWTDLLAHGLVDELYLLIGPKIVAGDHHAFVGVPEADLRLLDAHRMDESDTVLLHYATTAAS